jgi:hypothetical protein
MKTIGEPLHTTRDLPTHGPKSAACHQRGGRSPGANVTLVFLAVWQWESHIRAGVNRRMNTREFAR